MEIIKSIQNRIYEIRGERVMLDFDLAALYEVATKALNQSVKRNIKRFPADFMFRLDSVEWEFLRSQVLAGSKDFVLRSQFVTSKKSENLDPSSLILKGSGGARYLPYAFTEPLFGKNNKKVIHSIFSRSFRSLKRPDDFFA
jgi:ORF6N domain